MPEALIRRRRRKAGSQQSERFAEIGDHFMGRRALPLLALTWSDENPQTDSGRCAGLDVAFLIAQDRAVTGVESEIGHSLQDHSRIGLTPRMVATILADAMQRVKRAVIDARD